MRDPDGPNLDRIQVVKGWLGKDGKSQERIFDVAVSGGRKIGADGRCKTLVGSTVDVANATYTNTIGAAMLSAYWKDPTFDASQRAFYYVRVIQIPSPRWTAYDQKRSASSCGSGSRKVRGAEVLQGRVGQLRSRGRGCNETRVLERRRAVHGDVLVVRVAHQREKCLFGRIPHQQR